ncbi:hypothetical protein ES705_23797 [subsurface metagenome]
MAKISEKRPVHCSLRHVGAVILKWDDGSYSVKCGLLKVCGDSCPYLKDAHYKSPFRRAPKYEPKYESK